MDLGKGASLHGIDFLIPLKLFGELKYQDGKIGEHGISHAQSA
jgi:hypothetical protein